MRKRKAQIAGEILDSLLKETGNVKCDRCTTTSEDGMTWVVWHTPDHPCPHAAEVPKGG